MNDDKPLESDPQWLVEREYLRWLGWLSCAATDRIRARAAMESVPVDAIEYEPHRKLYGAMRAVLASGQWPTLLALFEYASDRISNLGGDEAVMLLFEMPAGNLPADCLPVAEEQAGWMLARWRRRMRMHALEQAKDASERGELAKATGMLRDSFKKGHWK